MGYLGDGRLGLNFGRFGRFDQKYFGRWENDLLEMGAGSTIFPTIFFFKNMKFTCYIYCHLNYKYHPYP